MSVHAVDGIVLAAGQPEAAAGQLAALVEAQVLPDLPERFGAAEGRTLALANTRLYVVGAGASPWGRLAAARLEADGDGLLGFVLAGAPVDPTLARDAHGVLPPRETRRVPIQLMAETSASPAVGGSPDAGVSVAVDHVVVRSLDADATRRLYGERLGIRVALDRVFEAFGARMIFCRVSSLSIEIVSPLETDDAAADGTDRLDGISFRVPDADAAVERLAALGFEPDPVRDGRKPGSRVSTVRNAPLGLRVLVIQQPPRENR